MNCIGMMLKVYLISRLIINRYSTFLCANYENGCRNILWDSASYPVNSLCVNCKIYMRQFLVLNLTEEIFVKNFLQWIAWWIWVKLSKMCHTVLGNYTNLIIINLRRKRKRNGQVLIFSKTPAVKKAG